jgi:hypothetical protein
MIAGKQRDGDFQWARSAHAALPEKENAALPLYRFTALPLCAFPIEGFGCDAQTVKHR